MSSQAQTAGSERAELAPLSGNVFDVFASPPAAKGVKTPLSVHPASPGADDVPAENKLDTPELKRLAAAAAAANAAAVKAERDSEAAKEVLMAHLLGKQFKETAAVQRAAELEARLEAEQKEKEAMRLAFDTEMAEMRFQLEAQRLIIEERDRRIDEQEQEQAESEAMLNAYEEEKASMVKVMVEAVTRLKVTSEAFTAAHQEFKTLMGGLAAFEANLGAALESRKL